MKTESLPSHAEPEDVIVLSPLGRDAELTVQLLGRERVAASVCANGTLLSRRILDGAGAAIIVEEALTDPVVDRIAQALAQQPPWSDFPFIVMTSSRGGVAGYEDRLGRLGNTTILERPTRVRAMLAAVRGALRARRRQYDARRAIEARDQFLAMLGHELRNPLAAVRLATSLLGRTGDVDRHRNVIDRQTQHLSRLIDDLLDVARVTYGKVSLRLEPLRLDEVIQRSCQSLEPMLLAGKISLHASIDCSLSVRGDRVRLEQVFANLVHNAVKYTPQGGAVAVTARSEKGAAVVRIRDTGIGLDADALNHVFELFAQVDTSLDRSRGGLGIGLTLVQSLVQLHGGSVHAASDGLGRGAEFRVQLPLAAFGSHRSESITTTRLRPDPPVRVVVVEDGPDNREMLKELLELEGHAVFTAVDGPTGVERILEVQPDVAFVDIGLPDFDGYEVARRVRAIGSKAVLVALTGYGQVEDRRRAGSAGFDAHLTKPVDLKDLQRTIVEVAMRGGSKTRVLEAAERRDG